MIEMNIDESEIVIVGDYQTFPADLYDNTPRNNIKRNPLSSLLRDFVTENELELIDITHGSGPTQTYEHKTLTNSSYVDHVAVLRNTNLSVENCTVHPKTSNNMSDHQPITFTLSTNLTSCAHTTPSYHSPSDELQSLPQVVPKFA